LLKALLSTKRESETNEKASVNPNTPVEQELGIKIASDLYSADAAKTSTIDELGFTIEDNWKDEEKIYKGGGLQWCTDFAYRSKRMRKIRPNSEDNFVFNAVQIQMSNITSTTPEIKITGTKNEHEVQAHKIQCASRYNDEKNNFDLLWRRSVLDFLKYGPAIMKVSWDSEKYGGRGPDRWIGDVAVEKVRKEDFLPDPAILDLELDMDSCSFIIQRYRKKLSYIHDRWEEYGKHVGTDTNTDIDVNEGFNPQMTYVYEYWHRGFPEYMPKGRKKELEQRAIDLEEKGYIYKAKDILDMSKGDIDGVHVAYYADGVLLEYVPYVYDHGKYPFAFSTRYDDEISQWGFGEIRNIKIPQVLHNKADEVEMEAMSRQGLGGFWYRRGSISPKQLEKIKEDNGKGGMFFEVNDTNGILPREGVQVPPSITNYKEHKQRMVETVSQVTAIQQGISPSASMPFKSLAELGARTDVRMRSAAEKLKYLLIKVNMIRIDLFEQFYTEERYYRLKGPDGKIVEDGTISNQMMYDVWIRETKTDELGNTINLEEHFIPDFDIEVDVISKKPTDRNFYANIAFTMFDRGAITKEDLWKTVDEGRLPDLDIVMQHLMAQDNILAMTSQLGELPPEVQQEIMQSKMAELQMIVQEAKRMIEENQMMQKGKGGGGGVNNPQNQTNKPQQQPKPKEFADNLEYSGGLVGGQNFDNSLTR